MASSTNTMASTTTFSTSSTTSSLLGNGIESFSSGSDSEEVPNHQSEKNLWQVLRVHALCNFSSFVTSCWILRINPLKNTVHCKKKSCRSLETFSWMLRWTMATFYWELGSFQAFKSHEKTWKLKKLSNHFKHHPIGAELMYRWTRHQVWVQ